MYQFLLAIILVLGGGSYWLYNQNQTLLHNNVVLEAAVEEQKQAMEAIKASYELQGQQLNNLARNMNQIEAERDRYLDIFRKHNLDRLALMRPGLVESRVNNATAAIFEEIENDSKNISDLGNSDSD